MTQVVLLKKENEAEEIYSDPSDPRLLERNLHLQVKIKRHLFESQSITIDMDNEPAWDKNW
jgi:hypothetical protein